MTSILIAALFLAIITCTIAMWVALLWCGLRWAKVSNVTTRKIVLAWFVMAILQAVVSVVVGISAAEGHPPYAVPESFMKGDATTTYWPPNRWRCFR